jgi:hypothetical protein
VNRQRARARARTHAIPVLFAALVLLAVPAGASARTQRAQGRQTAAIVDPDGDRLDSTYELDVTHTDPNNPDSNGNGIRDGAEDPDHDGLSNAGEQRFGTNPAEADSNGNGISDWHEDSNNDGIPDGLEQDAAPVPGDLTPTLDAAHGDVPPSYLIGCHTLAGDTRVKTCSFGDLSAPTKIVLFGDSHAAQWLPALAELGTTHHWHIISITKSSCPPATVTVLVARKPYAECDVWRKAAIKRITRIAPTVVFAIGREGYGIFDHGMSVSPARSRSQWKAGLARTLDLLHAASPRVLVLGETPHLAPSPAPWPASCLAASSTDMSVCSYARKDSRDTSYDALDRAVTTAHHATFRPIAHAVCPYDPCPAVIDRYVIYRDSGHLTATYAALLAPAIEKVLLSAFPSLGTT